jgi:Cu(I)/Ag(I) efflux system membrane fusion protein
MSARVALIVLAAAAGLAVAAALGFWIGKQTGRPAAPVAGPPAAKPATVETERKVLYWYDPMRPEVKFDKPGKSPFMDMQLMPKYADEVAGTGVSIDPRMAQNLGVRTAAAEAGTFWRRVDTAGSVQADERRIVSVQSRVTGWIERLHVRAVNDRVARGQALAEIYAPDLLAAQEEYLLLMARQDSSESDRQLADAARQRLSLLGLSDAQIEQVRSSGKAQRSVGVFAPTGGIVQELGAREGAQVNPGMSLFTLVDLSSVWVMAEVPEGQLAWIGTGRAAKVRISAYPSEQFDGRVDFIYPGVNPETRTVRARLSVPNPALKLKPGMLAEVTIFGGPKREVLLVPTEAVIRTGTRSLVIVSDGPGKFRPVPVELGMEGNGKTEVTSGLEAGEQVVVSGQFLLDSEANLRAGLSRLEGPAAQDEHAGHEVTAAGGEHAGHQRAAPQDEHIGHKAPVAKDEHASHQAPAPQDEQDGHQGHK